MILTTFEPYLALLYNYLLYDVKGVMINSSFDGSIVCRNTEKARMKIIKDFSFLEKKFFLPLF